MRKIEKTGKTCLCVEAIPELEDYCIGYLLSVYRDENDDELIFIPGTDVDMYITETIGKHHLVQGIEKTYLILMDYEEE